MPEWGKLGSNKENFKREAAITKVLPTAFYILKKIHNLPFNSIHTSV